MGRTQYVHQCQGCERKQSFQVSLGSNGKVISVECVCGRVYVP